MSNVGRLQNYPPVQQYLEARHKLHEDIQSKHLLGSYAVQVDDQVTLKRDWVHQDGASRTVYKAGTTYSLDPYAHRKPSHESITFDDGSGNTTLIQHDYSASFTRADEMLSVDTVRRSSGAIGNGGSFSMHEEHRGIRPQGWMQEILPEEYILRM